MKRLALILGLAFGLRLALGWAHPFWFPDSVDYNTLAQGMLKHGTYEVGGKIASRMPGYPIFLAGAYGLFGDSVRAALILQAAMGAGIVWMTYLLARRAGEAVGLLAALLAALDPLSVAFSAAVLSETPFTLLLLVGIWICVRIAQGVKRDWYWWTLLGLVWAAAVYLRAEALWCVVPLGAAAGIGFSRSWSKAPWPAGVLLAVVIVFLMLAPWQARNFARFGQGYFRLTTLEGISLYEAVYPGADGGPKQDTIALPPEMRRMNEAERNDEWMRRGWQEVRQDPGRIAVLAVKKIGRTWSPFLNAGEFQNRAVQAAMGLWHIPLFILAAIGIFVRLVCARMKALLLVPIFYFTAVHALFLGSVRYRVPLMPLVCLFAAAGLVHLASRWRGSKQAAPVMQVAH